MHRGTKGSAIRVALVLFDDGNQRPNVICNPSSGISAHQSALSASSANPLSVFNPTFFANPAYEQPGNAPRFLSNLRVDGIHNIDVSIEKAFIPHEGMRIEVQGEFFNFFNTPRFAIPGNLWGDSTFGQISSKAMGSTQRHGQLGLRPEF